MSFDPKRTLACLAVLATAVALGACGGDDDSGSTRAADAAFDDIPAFSKTALSKLPADGWPTNGGALGNQRYSPLDEIDRDNVADLKGVWKVDLGSGNEPKHSAEAQPIVYRGVLYVVTGANDVSAIDVKSGEVKWTHEAGLDEEIKTVCCGWTSRGVAIGDDKVYVGQLDGTLVALDATDGSVEWTATVGDPTKGETVTAAPLYYGGKVYSGISGGEFGIRGRLTAFDAKSGEELWKSWTIPAEGEDGHETWPEGSDVWEHGGAPIWQTPAVDPERDMLYLSTGNVSPDFDGSSRPGDNLYSSSVLALDADSGEIKWHYQMVHHDLWDYDSPTPLILFDVEVDGEEHAAVASTSKTGWVYVLDRETGEPIHGITEKAVPQDATQHTSPTQPFPEGDAFVPQSVPKAEADRLRKADPDAKWKYTNGGKIFTPFHGQGGVIAAPATLGGANWPPSSFSPDTNYMYICASDTISVFTSTEVQYEPGPISEGTSLLGSAFSAPKGVRMNGTITAMDMRTNRIAWQNKLTGENCYSGTVATAGGLVFVGRNDGRLTALNDETGEELWSFQTGAGANSTASVFEMDGTQYVAFYAGGNSLGGTAHGDNMWLFSLDGTLDEAPKPGPLAEAKEATDEGAGEEAQGEQGAADKPEEGVAGDTSEGSN